jgi:hypothetical protein
MHDKKNKKEPVMIQFFRDKITKSRKNWWGWTFIFRLFPHL